MHRIIAAMLTLAIASPAWGEPACGPNRPMSDEALQQIYDIDAMHLATMERLFDAWTKAEPLSAASHRLSSAIEAAEKAAERARSRVFDWEIARELAECGYIAVKPVR